MQYRLSEVEIYNSYGEDPDEENSFRYEGEAVPVYAYERADGECVLTTNPEEGAAMFGRLHVFKDPDPDEGDRFIVVRQQVP